MTAVAPRLEPNSPPAIDFLQELVRQMRALDTYGVYDDWPAERILAPFVRTREQRRSTPVVGDPDAATLARMQALYNAIAASVEKACGHMAVPLVNLNPEGFGRALITVGRLVVVDRTLRDVHRFGFETLAKLESEGEKRVGAALELVDRYPEVAGL
jgi:probable nitrogen fixation protein